MQCTKFVTNFSSSIFPLFLSLTTIACKTSSANKICLHDFKIKLDENPFTIQIIEKNEGKKIFIDKIYNQYQQAAFGIGFLHFLKYSICSS